MMKNENIEEVIRTNTPLIFRYCLSKLNNNHHDAKEITSSVMILLHKKWYKLSKKHIKAWIFRVADNEIKSYWRNCQKERKRRLDIHEADELFDELLVYDNYDDKLSDEDVQRIVSEIYEDLSADEKAIFDAIYRHKFTFKEASDRLNMPKTTLFDKSKLLEEKLRKTIKELSEHIGI